MKLCNMPALHWQLNHLEWHNDLVVWDDLNTLLETGAEVYTGHLHYMQWIFHSARKPDHWKLKSTHLICKAWIMNPATVLYTRDEYNICLWVTAVNSVMQLGP